MISGKSEGQKTAGSARSALTGSGQNGGHGKHRAPHHHHHRPHLRQQPCRRRDGPRRHGGGGDAVTADRRPKRYLPFPLARRRPRPSSRWSAGLPAVAPPIWLCKVQPARSPPTCSPLLCRKPTAATAPDQPRLAQPRGQIPIAPAALPAPHCPRLRALALFGRRPPERVVGIVIAESLYDGRSLASSKRNRMLSFTWVPLHARNLLFQISLLFTKGRTSTCCLTPAIVIAEPHQYRDADCFVPAARASCPH